MTFEKLIVFTHNKYGIEYATHSLRTFVVSRDAIVMQ